VGSPTIFNPVVKPIIETIFTVIITDKNGCKFTDDVKVCIIEDPLSLFKPVSIITPNGDGKNDDLYFAGLEAFPDNSLKIFNRWGNLLFEANGYQTYGSLFNGLRNGDRLPADTYYYVLIFEDQVIKSSLTIIWD
jgi:gliding motility-associated-like protein